MILGTVAAIDNTKGITVVVDGETAASEKKYSYLASYVPAVSDKILIEEINGSYVILGKICTEYADSGQAQYAANAEIAAHAIEADHADTARVSESCSGNASTATVAARCTGNAATATTAAKCTGNAATATTAASCTGNAATATTAVNASYATSAGRADEARHAAEADEASLANIATYANRAGTADTATTATSAAKCTGNAATATTAAKCTGNAATATVSNATKGFSSDFFNYVNGKLVTSVTSTWNAELRTYIVTDISCSLGHYFTYK